MKCDDRRACLWRSGVWLGLGVALVSWLTLLPYLGSATDLVRIRNALTLERSDPHDFDWTPDRVPASYRIERHLASPVFVAAAAELGLARLDDDWRRVIAISRHLLGARPLRDGPPIQAGLDETYRRIVNKGDGYCGDFVPVFIGLAHAAGLTARPWAFSLDSFGGLGHIWVEVWNRQLGRWQLVDIYNNVYFHRGDGVAVSAAEFRRALATGQPVLRRALLHEAMPPGYPFEDKMWAYYRRGLDQWYMPWGNDVFAYDNAFPARRLGGVSLALEQLAAIAIGVFPRTRLLESDGNRPLVDAIWRLRFHLHAVVVAALAGLLLAGASLLAVRRLRRRIG